MTIRRSSMSFARLTWRPIVLAAVLLGSHPDLEAAIEQCRPGRRLSDIGRAVQSLAEVPAVQ